MKAILLGIALSAVSFTPEVIEYSFSQQGVSVDVDVYSPQGEYLHTLKVRAGKSSVELFNVVE